MEKFFIIENKHVFQLTLGKLERKDSLDNLHLITCICQLNHLEYLYLEFCEESFLDVLRFLPNLRQIRIRRKRFLMINNKLLEEKK